MAVLAVAFVVLAAVPVALTDSDAAAMTSTDIDANAKTAGTEITEAGIYVVTGSTKITLTSTTFIPSNTTLYLGPNATVTIAKTSVTVTNGFKVYLLDGTTKYYADSEATVKAPSVATAVDETLKVVNGGYVLSQNGANKLTIATGDELNYIKASYSKSIAIWTTGMASKVGTLDEMTVGTEAEKVAGTVTFNLPNTSDNYGYSVSIADGTNSAKFTGPMAAGTAGSMAVTSDGTYTITWTTSADLTSGTIERTKGSVKLSVAASALGDHILNGVCLDFAKKVISDSSDDLTVKLSGAAANVFVLPETKLGGDVTITTDAVSPVTIATLGKGLTTTSSLNVAVNTTTTMTLTSSARWTGAAITVESTITTLNLGTSSKIGSLTVESYGTAEVTVSNGTDIEIWGTLTVNDNEEVANPHTKCNVLNLTAAIVTESGSIVVGENVKLTPTTSLTVLGTVSGEGTIGTGVSLYTQDGTKSNITVSNADALTVTGQAKSNNQTSAAGIDDMVEKGYTYIQLGALIITGSYTFPEGVVLDVGANKIIINSGSKESERITLTLPSSSTLKIADALADPAIPTGGIVVGSTTDASTGKYATFVVEGKLTGTGYIYGAGAFELASTGRIQDAGISILTQTASGDNVAQEFSGASLSVPYPMYQKLTVPEGKTITISSLSTVAIYGELQIDGTLVIEDEAKLVLGLGKTGITTIDTTGATPSTIYIPQAATVKVSSTGSIQIAEGGELDIVNASVTASGSIELDGTLLMENASTLTVKSSMTESSTGTIGMKGTSKITVASGAVMKIEGYIGSTDYTAVQIFNSGSVVIDNSSVTARSAEGVGSASIYMTADGANVTFESYISEGSSASKIAVSDKYMSLAKIGKVTYYAGAVNGTASSTKVAEDAYSTFTIGAAAVGVKLTGDLVITEELASEADEDVLAVTSRLLVSGSVSNGTSVSGSETPSNVTLKAETEGPVDIAITGDDTSIYTVAIFASAVAVAEENTLVIGQYVELSNAGLLMVDGYLDMTVDKALALKNAGGIVTVDGTVKIKQETITGGTVNAAYYVSKEAVGSSTANFNVYTSLDQAVEGVLSEENTSTDKTVTLYGIVELDESVTVESPVKVKFNSSNAGTNMLYVGTDDNSDVVLTFEDGTKFTSAKNQVEVPGTMYFANKKDDATNKTVCDVKVESGDAADRTYTNIYTALEAAEPGSTVEVTREATDADGATQYVELTRSVTIGEGVTLRIASSVAGLYLYDGVTLTVNGTLYTDKDVIAETQFEATASTIVGDKSSAVVVNGIVKGIKTQYKTGAEGSDVKLTDGAPIAGAYYTDGTTYYLSTLEIAEENFAKVSGAVNVYGKVVAGDLSFAKTSTSTGTSLVINSKVGTLVSSLTASSITLDGVSVVVKDGGLLTAVVDNGLASVNLSKITGGLTVQDKDDVLYVTGTATASDESVFEIAEGTVVAGISGTSGSTFAYTADSDDNALVVASGAVLEPESVGTIDKLTVDGEFSVPQGKEATVGVLVVNGSVDVFAGSDTASASNLKVDELWIGTSAGTTQKTAATASFSGPVSVTELVVVAAGASVDSDAQAYLDKITLKTAFYVNDSVWITAYNVDSDTTIGAFNNPVITNAYFAGWYNSDYESASAKTIGATGFDKVYASITTKVYHVIIKADQGIGDLYLNGNIMSKGQMKDAADNYFYAYWADVEAGDYTVTCKLANGYSGTAVLKDSTGKDISGNKFTASGTPSTPAGITLNYQLTGIEKSGYVDPVEPQKEDNSLKVTDYLLIVLVILVVVLAVIVALRLMRS